MRTSPLTVLVLAVLVVVGLAGFASPSSAAVRHRTYYTASDGHHPLYKPRTLPLSTDGNVVMRRAVWTSWGSASAHAHGRIYVHQSQFGGRDYSFPATAGLSRPRKYCGKYFFTAQRWRNSRTHDTASAGYHPQFC